MVQLYKDYVSRTVGALARTLAFASNEQAASSASGPSSTDAKQRGAPMLPVPPAFGMRLDAGQLIALTPSPSARRDGGDGGLRVAMVVGEGGRSADGAVGGVRFALSVEHCSQAVMPWRQAAEDGWEASLRIRCTLSCKPPR